MIAIATPVPEKTRWTLLRAGVQNIWEYDSQVFVCHKGRLLLRGRNESGKTKALEVLFPFLLDADLAPHRMDPFGSTARQMRFNLIHDGNPDVRVSIGYVWMEFGRRTRLGDEYFTIGAGLRAVKSHTELTVWFFTTPLRVGVDFNLLADTREPLPRKALEEALKERGHVWERRSDYRQEVNRTLFGMPDDQYGALVDTLIKLRQPQLSRDLDLPRLSELLTASLPPLEESVIRPIAEGFERLDRHHFERDAAERNLKAVLGFEKVYREYLRAESKATAQRLTAAESAYHRSREILKEAVERRDTLQKTQEDQGRELESLGRADRELGGRLEALKASEEYKAVEALDRAEADVRAQEERGRRAAASEGEERASLRVREARRCQAATDLERLSGEAERDGSSAREAAQRAGFGKEHAVLEGASSKGAVEALVEVRREDIAVVERESRKLIQAESEAKLRRETLGRAESALADALGRMEQARRMEETVRREHANRVGSWRSGTRVLGTLPELDSALAEDDLHRVPGIVQAAASTMRVELGTRLEDAAMALRKAAEEVERLRGELNALVAQTHRRPPAPAWRPAREPGRPGAPFYMICEFAAKDASVQAGLEAALESSGLLDAWVTPEGIVLDPGTKDVLFDVRPAKGRTLLDFLKPCGRDGVSEAHAKRILQTVRVADDEPGDGSCWVAVDGRWGNGPLRGAWSKAAAAYIGESARERERERRRAEIEGLLANREHERAQASSRRMSIRGDQAALEAEVLALPPLLDVERAGLAKSAAEEEAGRKRTLKEEESRAAAAAEKRFAEAKTRRDVEAAERRLTAWVDHLSELNGLISQYRDAALEALRAAVSEAAGRVGLARAEEDRDECARKLDTRVRELRVVKEELEKLQAWVKGLRETAGASRDEVLREARELSGKIHEVKNRTDEVRRDQRMTDMAVGAAKSGAEVAEQAVSAEDVRRKEAESVFRNLAGDGLLDAAGLKPAAASAEWSSRDALLEARRVDMETKEVDPGEEVREDLQNKLAEKHREIQLALPPEIKVTPSLEKGIWRYPCRQNGRTLTPAELVEGLKRDVEERERRLGEDERALLETFLSGETRQHLCDRLRGARELVDSMNAQIDRCPTASGTRIRLKWEVAAEAAQGSRRAIDLLLKSAELLTDADRKALKEFLHGRLEEARTRTDEATSLVLRMSEILDFRKWHAFTVEHREGAGDWKPLTRKSHAAGSGGKKAMMLHLPLFAAAAAFYESAAGGAARLIALDEAFAGIDRQARGELMGLLAALDLDFLMTSHEEWGFYGELDGLSTYHLSRETDCRGVLAERFLWDGHEAVRVEEA